MGVAKAMGCHEKAMVRYESGVCLRKFGLIEQAISVTHKTGAR